MLKKHLLICLIAYFSTMTSLHGKEMIEPVFQDIRAQSTINFQHVNGAFGKNICLKRLAVVSRFLIITMIVC
jgi:hypothetical protein